MFSDAYFNLIDPRLLVYHFNAVKTFFLSFVPLFPYNYFFSIIKFCSCTSKTLLSRVTCCIKQIHTLKPHSFVYFLITTSHLFLNINIPMLRGCFRTQLSLQHIALCSPAAAGDPTHPGLRVEMKCGTMAEVAQQNIQDHLKSSIKI